MTPQQAVLAHLVKRAVDRAHAAIEAVTGKENGAQLVFGTVTLASFGDGFDWDQDPARFLAEPPRFVFVVGDVSDAGDIADAEGFPAAQPVRVSAAGTTKAMTDALYYAIKRLKRDRAEWAQGVKTLAPGN